MSTGWVQDKCRMGAGWVWAGCRQGVGCAQADCGLGAGKVQAHGASIPSCLPCAGEQGLELHKGSFPFAPTSHSCQQDSGGVLPPSGAAPCLCVLWS